MQGTSPPTFLTVKIGFVAATALGLAAWAPRARAQALSTFLTTEHADINLGYSGGAWRLTNRNSDDPGGIIEYNTGDALLYAGTPSQRARPSGAAFDFTGVSAGQDFYVLPQSQDPALLYMGFAAYGVNASEFDRYNPSAESKGRVGGNSRWVKASLIGVTHTTPSGAAGSGKFSLWQSGDSGPVVLMSNHNDGVSNPNSSGLDATDGITTDDALWLVAGGHTHYNFGFSEPGRYALQFKLSGYIGDGGVSNATIEGTYSESPPFTVYVSVGSVGELELDAATYSVNEDAGTASVNVRRVGGRDGRISVNYATSNGTATAGSDYTAASGALTFNDLETLKTITIPIIDDATDEPNETVNLALSNPAPPSINNYLVSNQNDANGLLGRQASATLTIVDNDDPANTPPTISDVANQATQQGTRTAPIAFTVGDAETAAASLSVTATSSNTALVPNANIVLSGSGANRSVAITPAANQSGAATITLRVADAGGLSATDTFVLTVNGPPTISDVANQTTSEDTPTGAIAFTVGDDSTPPASLIVTATSSNTALVPNANIALGGSGANRSVAITPAANQSGTATITLRVADASGLSATDTFVLQVLAANDAPTISSVAGQSTNEDTPTGAIAFTIGDIETAAGDLVVSATSSNTALVPNANIVLGGSGASRTVTVTPAADQSGTATITLRVADADGLASTRTFGLQVLAVNDAPVLDNAGAMSLGAINEDEVNNSGTRVGDIIASAGGDRITDVDAGALEGIAVIAADVSHGAWQYSTDGGATWSALGAVSSTSARLLAANAATRVRFVPASNFSGVVDPGLTFRAWDQSSGSNGGTANASVDGGASAFSTATETAAITVSAIDDAPTISAIASQSTSEDTATGAIAFTIGDSETPAASLTVRATSSDAALVPNANIVLGGAGASRTLTITPAANQNGSSTITVTVSDGSTSTSTRFALQVLAVNDAPSFTVGANQSVGEDAGAQTVAGFATSISEGAANESAQALAFTVTSTNSALFAVQPALSSSGTLTYTPAPNASGAATVSVTLRDNGGTERGGADTSAAQSFTITVNAQNDAPTISAIANQSTDEDTPTGAIAFTVGDVETAAGDLTVTATSSNTALVPNASIVLGGSGANRSVAITPAANQSGTTTITLTATDGDGLASTRAFTLQVLAVNDAPTISAIASRSTDEDTPTGAIAFTVGDGETAPGSLTVTATSSNTALVPNASIVLGGSGANRTATITPAANQSGTTTITLTVADAGGLSASSSFTLQVLAINDAPVAQGQSLQTEKDRPLSLTLSASDVDSAAFGFTIVSGPSHGTLSGTGATRTYTPNASFVGSDSFSFRANDGALDSDVATISIAVASPNVAPAAVDDTSATDEDTPVTVQVLGNDSDANGDALAIARVSVAADTHGTVAIAPDKKSVLFTPAADFFGTARFAYTVTDGAAEGTATVAIAVTPVNDAPVALSQALAATTTAPLALTLTATDIDSPQSGLTFSVLTQPANGTLSGSGTSLRYTARRGFSGTDSFTFRANDGSLSSNVATVTLRVSDTNAAPVARDDAARTAFNVPVAVQVLANDTDADGDTLSVTSVSASGTRGTLRISDDRRSVLFTPEAGFSGTTSFGYTVSDGVATASARATITVDAQPEPPVTPEPPAPANRAPVAVADSYASNGTLRVPAAQGVLQNDTDADGNALSVFLDSVPRHGRIAFSRDGSFVYTPAVGYSGRDSFTYKVFDGKEESAPATVALQVAATRDVTPPVVELAGGAVRTVRALLPPRGVAADVYVLRGTGIVVSSGLRGVTVRLQRGDGQHWNGRAYQRAPFDLRATVDGRSFFVLSDALPPSAAGRYRWSATATDNAGNRAVAQQTVIVDATAPAVRITAPQASADGVARLGLLSSISGTVSEESTVAVVLRDARGQFFDGTGFGTTPTFLPATLSGGSWTLELPTSPTLPPGRYRIDVRATDQVGNIGTATRLVEVASAPRG